MTTADTTRKAETPATIEISASQKPVIGGNFGLGIVVTYWRTPRPRIASRFPAAPCGYV
jgi:hypothetical protein